MVGKTNAKGSGSAPIEQYLYGYDLTVADSNPATRVVYPMDVDNSAYTPASMNFTTDIFNYGGWNLAVGEKFMPRPCMLLYDGTVDYYLDSNDYTKKSDGVTASDITNTAYGGNAMMEWGKIYTHRSFYNGVYSFRISDIKLASDWDCWCNYDKDNNEINHFYTPIYFGSSDGTRLRSLSGKTNYTGGTSSEEITLATANGTDWYTEVLADHLLIQDLLTLMAKNTSSQEKYGNGRCSAGSTTVINTGTMDTKGMFWGSNDATSGVKVFGMENRWGNLWHRTAGWINARGTQKVKITRGTHDGSVATDYNLDGADYITLESATPSGTNAGYISSMKNDLPFGRIPITASGSTTTYECDSFYFNNAITGYAVLGGSYASTTTAAGAFTGALHWPSTNEQPLLGASITYK